MGTENPITNASKEVCLYFRWLFDIGQVDIREIGVVGRFKILLNLWYFDAKFGEEISKVEEYANSTFDDFFADEFVFDNNNIEHIVYHVVNYEFRTNFETTSFDEDIEFSDIQKMKCVMGLSEDLVSTEYLFPFASRNLS
jgi:hypothetical protein